MPNTVEFTATYAEFCCSECGIVYYVPDNWQRKRRDRHDTFYCPNGHSQHYPAKSDAERLRDELARERHRLEQAQARARDLQEERDAAHRRAAAARGQVTKIRNRVGKGVCPCCNRTFQNLQRHMQSQHPTWAPENETAESAS